MKTQIIKMANKGSVVFEKGDSELYEEEVNKMTTHYSLISRTKGQDVASFSSSLKSEKISELYELTNKIWLDIPMGYEAKRGILFSLLKQKDPDFKEIHIEEMRV
jgi:hypothetical protein